MKVVIYVRVSTDRQEYQRQVEEIKEKALRDGLKENEIEVFSDKISGKTKIEEREGLTALLDAVNRESIDRVYVWEISRLFRKLEFTLNLVNKLTEKKIPIHEKVNNIVTLNEDGTENSMAKLSLSIMGAIAENELTTIQTRTSSGRLSSAKKGNHTGGLVTPYGFDSVDKKLMINETEAENVRKMFELCLKGDGMRKIANYLNAYNIPTKFASLSESKKIKVRGTDEETKDTSSIKWGEGSVHKILTNTLYKGEKHYKDLIIPITPIVTDETFELAKLKLAGRKNKAKRNEKFPYLFRDKIVCGVCGKTFMPKNRVDGSDSYFICSSTRNGENCGNKGISINGLESAVWGLVSSLDFLNALAVNKETDIAELQNTVEERRTAIKDKEAQKPAFDAKINKLLDLYTDGGIDRNRFVDKRQECLDSISGLDKEIEAYRNEINAIHSKIELLTSADFNADQIAQIHADRVKMKQILDVVLKTVTVKYNENYAVFSLGIELSTASNFKDKDDITSTIEALYKRRSNVLTIIDKLSNAILLYKPVEVDGVKQLVLNEKFKTETELSPVYKLEFNYIEHPIV